MAKKVTMQQIADSLQVSKFVVSKALSGKGGVSEATKERVLQAASQLGYFSQKHTLMKQAKRDPMSQAAVGDKQSVLVLMPNIRFQTKDSLYWGRILDGITTRVEEAGLSIIMISEQSPDQFLRVLNPEAILGMIGVGEINSNLLLEVHRSGLPMILVDHEDPLLPSDSVFVNNFDCMYRLTKHLIGLGHKQLMFLGNIRYSRSFQDRFIGFRSALEEAGLGDGYKDELLLNLEGFQSFDEQVRVWVSKRKKGRQFPTALVCANDSIAIDTMSVLKEMGVSVPEEVSVTGFDNIENSLRTEPPLTTVNVPKETLGKRAVEKLLERIGKTNEPTEKLLVSGEVMYRDSIVGRKEGT